MSDQQKLSERMEKYADKDGPAYFVKDWIAGWAKEAEALETQLLEAIRERDEARALTSIWEKATREACNQRDALAKALQFIMSELNLVKDINPEAWAEFYNEIVMETPNQRFSEAWKEADNALNAALERPAPAEESK